MGISWLFMITKWLEKSEPQGRPKVHLSRADHLLRLLLHSVHSSPCKQTKMTSKRYYSSLEYRESDSFSASSYCGSFLSAAMMMFSRLNKRCASCCWWPDDEILVSCNEGKTNNKYLCCLFHFIYCKNKWRIRERIEEDHFFFSLLCDYYWYYSSFPIPLPLLFY